MTHNVNTGLVKSWQVVFMSSCLSQRNEYYGPEEKGHGQRRSSTDLEGGETISFLFIYGSCGSIFIVKLLLSGRYFLARRGGLTLQGYPYVDSVSFPSNKPLR